MRRSGVMAMIAGIGLLGAVVSPARAAGGDDDDWIRDTGDVLQVALPVLGGGATFFANPDPDATWDREGTKQFVRAYGTAWGSTYVIKILASKARPNGANRTSFPSGHTMSAFTGAAFIDGRFGRTFGIPAYALALFTGYSRVHSGWHYRDDVLAGASIGLISNWYWVSPLPGKVQFVPTVGRDGLGINFSVSGNGAPADPAAEATPRGASYRFGFGPAFVRSNVAGSQGEGDSRFNLADLNGFNDPTTTAVVDVRVPVSAAGGLTLRYSPFEARDEGAFTEDVRFGGAVFPAGSELDSSWRYYDLSLAYDHALVAADRWNVQGSVGVGVAYSYATLATRDGTANVLVDDATYYPYLGVAVEYRLAAHWAVGAWVSGIAISGQRVFDAGGELIWRPARAWDVALGYVGFERRLDSATLYNDVSYDIPYAAITRYW